MIRASQIAFTCLLGFLAALQANGQTAPSGARPAYQPFRYDEDWSSLADESKRSDRLDFLKYISLNRAGWFVSLGGEIRERFELLDQPGFGTGPADDNGYFLQRYLSSADFHLGSRVRFFTEFQSGLESGRNSGPRPTDLDRLDLHQAFVDWKLSSAENHEIAIRIGRQELGFGSGRLISPAEGLNLRRSLDGARLMGRIGKVTWNATALRLARSLPGLFDDVPDHAQTLWGAGLTAPHPLWKADSFGLYYFGLDRKNAVFEKGIGRAIRHTIGTRSWRTAGRWDFNYEGIVQWGSFKGMPIRAWALSEDTGFTLATVRFRPRFGLRGDVATGDAGPKSRTLGSFDPLLAAAPVYSGPSGLLGPTNLMDVSPSLRLQLRKNLSLTIECSSFWRENLGDGIYSPFVTPVRRSQSSNSRYVATAPSATLAWQLSRHLSYSVIFSHFFTGGFLRDNPPNRDVNYLASWVTYHF